MEERGENRKPIWWVRPLDDRLRVDETAGHLFRGDDDAMGKHINELHRRTGVPYCAQSVGA
jgi:hypothetical protein